MLIRQRQLLQHTLLKNPPKVAKSATCNSGTSHLHKSMTRIRPQVRHHQIHRIVPCDKLVGTKACHQWGDAANMTHHQVSLSSPQTKGGNSKSPRATSLYKSDRGQSGCSWYPKANQDQCPAVCDATTVQP